VALVQRHLSGAWEHHQIYGLFFFLPFTISDEPDPLTEDESDLCQIRSLAKSCKLFQFDIEEGE